MNIAQIAEFVLKAAVHKPSQFFQIQAKLEALKHAI